MKIGFRKRSYKRSLKAMTTARVKRNIKKRVIPFYGRKGTGIKHPKKAIYNKIYNKTTFKIPGLYLSDYKDKPSKKA